MATRFYFNTGMPGSIALARPLAGGGLWESNVGSLPTTRKLGRTALGTANNAAAPYGQAMVVGNGVNPNDVLFFQGISEPLAAQTISGTFSGVACVRENNLSANASTKIGIFVVNSAGTRVATLYGGATTSTEYNNPSANTRNFGNAVAITSYTCAAGDRIVVEVGTRMATTNTTYGIWMYLGDPGGSDLPLGDGASNNLTINPWVELSANLLFLNEVGTLIYDRFDREDTANNPRWGNAEIGQWTSPATSGGILSVFSGRGRIDGPEAGESTTRTESVATAKSHHYRGSLRFNSPAAGVYFQAEIGKENVYRLIAYTYGVGMPLSLSVEKFVGGVWDLVDGGTYVNTTVESVVSNTDYEFEGMIRENGDGTTTLRARMWNVGAAVPDWQFDVIDSEATLQNTTAAVEVAGFHDFASTGTYRILWNEIEAHDLAQSFTIDAEISSGGGPTTETGSFTEDAIVLRGQTGSLTGSAVIKGAGSGTGTLDAIVRRVGTGSGTADAVLQRTATHTWTLDAEIVAAEGGETLASFTGDAILSASQTGSFPAQAVVLQGRTSAFDIGAVQRSPRAGSWTIDAAVRTSIVQSLTADAALRGVRSAAVLVDGVILGSVARAATADAAITAPRTGSWTFDASIVITQQASFVVGAVVLVQPQGSFVLEALTQKLFQGELGVSAVLRLSHVGTFPADAVVRRSHSPMFTSDAITLRQTTQGVTFDAVLGLASLSPIDAVTTVPQLGWTSTTRFLEATTSISSLEAATDA